MTEPQTAASAPEGTSGGPSGAGALLRGAREAAGIHIAALAGALKVPVSRLEALEAERFDLLPDPPFVRALAGSVCRVLKLDPGPILARLPQKKPAQLEEEVRGTAARSFRSSGGRKPALAEQFSRPVVWSVGLLLIGAIVLITVPSERWGEWKASLQERLAASEADASPAPVAASAPASVPPVAATAPVPETSAAPAEVATPPAAAEPAAAVVPAAPGVVAFTATGDSWIKVTDARGTVVLQKLLVAGANAGATGELPLAVVIGRADVTQVQVRGTPFDLAAIARNNVARFEVK